MPSLEVVSTTLSTFQSTHKFAIGCYLFTVLATVYSHTQLTDCCFTWIIKAVGKTTSKAVQCEKWGSKNWSYNLAHEFGMNFGDAVDGARALYRQVGSRISR